MKEIFKEARRMIFNQFLMISAFLLLAMGIMQLFSSTKGGFNWYFPFQILGVSLSTSLLSIVFVSKNEQTRKDFMIRCIIHFILLVGVVLTEGFFFTWWSNPIEILIVLAVLIFVYVCVWVFSLISDHKMSNNINKALKNISDKEE